MKSLVKNNTIPSKVNTLLPLHEGHGQILKYLCSPISLIPRPMHVHTFYGVNHLWAWYICSCACLMLRTSTIYDSSLCANCSGTLLCRHACASHTDSICPIRRFTLMLWYLLALHCRSWQYKYAYVGFGNPVQSVMGNRLNIHVHKCWNVKYRRECCRMITFSQVHCLALGQSSWAGSQACSQAATFHFSSALRSSLIFSSFKSSTNCIQACRIQCFRHLQALEHHHQFWLIILLHTSEWMCPSQRRRNQGTV